MFVYYDESILRYVASIRNYYGLDSSYKADEDFTNYLNTKKPEKIFVLLIDAMGANLLEQKLPKDAFLRKNMRYKTTSVFPPTTTAATTAILCGKSPNETGWLGWHQYFKELDDDIVPFLGVGFYSNKAYGNDICYKKLPYTNIVDELNSKGIKSRLIYGFRPEEHAKHIRPFAARIKEIDKQDYKFLYAYYDQLDTLMHFEGVNCKRANERFLTINNTLENLANSLNKGTMLVILADHGQIEIKEHINLFKSPLKEYFSIKPSIEFRTTSFFIKEGYLEKFEKEFKELYEDKFILLDKKQVLYTHLFGDHKNSERLEDFIGDFVAVAKDYADLIYEEKHKRQLKGQHAGILKDELMVPVITYMK